MGSIHFFLLWADPKIHGSLEDGKGPSNPPKADLLRHLPISDNYTYCTKCWDSQKENLTKGPNRKVGT